MAGFEIPEYTVQDFQEILFPTIFDIPEGESIMDRLGESDLDFPEFKVPLGKAGFKPGDKDKVIRYIVCVYDIKSPFLKDYQEINHRKVAAALYVGFEVDKFRKFSRPVEDMLMGDCDATVDMTIRYCRCYNSVDYSWLVAIWNDFYRILKDIQTGQDYDYTKASKIRADIKLLSREFLNHDDSTSLKEKLYREIEKDSLALSPEAIAQKLEDGLSAITNSEVSDYRSDHIVPIQPTGDKSDSK